MNLPKDVLIFILGHVENLQRTSSPWKKKIPLENSIDCKKGNIRKMEIFSSQNGVHLYNGLSALGSLGKVIFQINLINFSSFNHSLRFDQNDNEVKNNIHLTL